MWLRYKWRKNYHKMLSTVPAWPITALTIFQKGIYKPFRNQIQQLRRVYLEEV